MITVFGVWGNAPCHRLFSLVPGDVLTAFPEAFARRGVYRVARRWLMDAATCAP